MRFKKEFFQGREKDSGWFGGSNEKQRGYIFNFSLVGLKGVEKKSIELDEFCR